MWSTSSNALFLPSLSTWRYVSASIRINFDDTIEQEAKDDGDELQFVLILDDCNPLLEPTERALVQIVAVASREFPGVLVPVSEGVGGSHDGRLRDLRPYFRRKRKAQSRPRLRRPGRLHDAGESPGTLR